MNRDSPSLRGLLADPLIRMVMASDGVVEGDILALARRHRSSQTHASTPPPRRAPDRDRCCQMMA